MNITFIRQDSGSGKETLSVCEAGTLFDKMKTETKVAIVIPNPSVHFAYESIMLNIFVWLCRKCECFDIVNESK